MRVTLEKEYKDRYTLCDLQIARTVIESMKEDDSTPAEYAAMAARVALKGRSDDWFDDVLKATATTARNGRIWSAYYDGSGMFDVWIDATIRTGKGFMIIGAYLTDIWQTGAADYSDHIYCRYFREEGL